MDNQEKIKIYVPKSVSVILDGDAVKFEILKSDGITINRNNLLVRLIKGFYPDYVLEYNEKVESVFDELTSIALPENEKKELSHMIVQRVAFPGKSRKKGVTLETLSLKPTKDICGLVSQIEGSLRYDESLSNFYCGLLCRYAEKPQYERERVIFKENYEVLKEACLKRRSISFSTIWNKDKIHEVLPYEVVVGKEEMCNYLLCQEKNSKTGQYEPTTYRLNRLYGVVYSRTVDAFNPKIVNRLEKMKQYSPQFVMPEEEEDIVVELTDEGSKLFNRIYSGRPIVDRIELKSKKTYVFKCSRDQAEFYFRKFGKDAVIISPDKLNQRMRIFFSNAYDRYCGG